MGCSNHPDFQTTFGFFHAVVAPRGTDRAEGSCESGRRHGVFFFFFSDVFLCPEKIEGQISNYVLKKHGVFFRFGVGWIRWILGAIFFCVGSFFFKKSFLEHLEFG